jgi:hypothetical protein
VFVVSLVVIGLTALWLDLGTTPLRISKPQTSVQELAPGQLILDAKPWAEVVSITRSSGENLELSGSRYTPLALSVEPGQYEVVLNNDSHGQRSFTVMVPSDETISETITFAAFSEDDLLRSLGVIE